MYGQKPKEDTATWITYPGQRWTHRQMVITTQRKLNEITTIEIDPSLRMADIDRRNNKLDIKW
jgi:hypothetical protein